jgi:hypothetical protein
VLAGSQCEADRARPYDRAPSGQRSCSGLQATCTGSVAAWAAAARCSSSRTHRRPHPARLHSFCNRCPINCQLH